MCGAAPGVQGPVSLAIATWEEWPATPEGGLTLRHENGLRTLDLARLSKGHLCDLADFYTCKRLSAMLSARRDRFPEGMFDTWRRRHAARGRGCSGTWLRCAWARLGLALKHI